MPEPQNQAPERSLIDLVRETTEASSRLIVDELKLARAELNASIEQMKAGLVWMAVGLVPLLLGIATIPYILILGLSEAMPGWAAALITALALIAGGGALAWVGAKKLRQQAPPLQRTMTTIKEDAQWLKRQLS